MYGGDTVEKRVTFIICKCSHFLIEGMAQKVPHRKSVSSTSPQKRNVRIFMQWDANVSPFKTLNTVSRWNGIKGQEN